MKDYIEIFPPHGFVRLVDWHGSELDIVNAARVSFHKESEWEKHSAIIDGYEEISQRLSKTDIGLIKYLLTNRHGSPFEQGFQSTWHVRLPIFVMREWVRHRIGHSVNEESGRYVEMRPDFYIPQQARTQHGKPGAYTFEFDDEDSYMSATLRNMIEAQSNQAFAVYQNLLSAGIAKEQARIVLPLNLYTEIRWTANARSLMNFLSLRNDRHAMCEIRKYAEALETIFAKHMPVTHQTFIDNNRVAP